MDINKCVSGSGKLVNLSLLTDEEWLDMILRGIDEANFGEIVLPQIPPEKIRGRSTGEKNAEKSLRLGFQFYQIINTVI